MRAYDKAKEINTQPIVTEEIEADPFRSDCGRSRTLTRHPYTGMQLYDLAGADLERRFSPYCWRIMHLKIAEEIESRSGIV